MDENANSNAKADDAIAASDNDESVPQTDR
jgi:hypothetical protein